MVNVPPGIRMAVADRSPAPLVYETNQFAVMKQYTAAQLNATGGASLIDLVPSNPKIRLISFVIIVGATGITGPTTLRVSDREATPNDFLSFLPADLTAGAKANMVSANTTVTVASLLVGSKTGYQIRPVGGTAVVGGPITVIASFDLIQ